MSVSAVTVVPVSVNPAQIRYSLFLNSLGQGLRGQFQLQRSQKNEDGTWLDDPRPSSSVAIGLPTDDATVAALQGIAAVLPAVLAKFGLAGAVAQFRLRVRSNLSGSGVLDEGVTMQVLMGGAWIVQNIPSLSAFLAANGDIAAQVEAAWNALDAALNAANAQQEWL